MLLVKDKLVKLGNIVISGQVRSIDITEAAIIEDIEDDKGNVKATQPVGYEAAKVTIELILDEYRNKSVEEQIAELQKLFHPSGQKKAKLIKIVNSDCSVRGISKVYFKSLSTQQLIEKTGRICTVELITPAIGSITVKKRGKKGRQTKKKANLIKSTKKIDRNPAFSYSKRNVRTYKNAIKTMIN